MERRFDEELEQLGKRVESLEMVMLAIFGEIVANSDNRICLLRRKNDLGISVEERKA